MADWSASWAVGQDLAQKQRQIAMLRSQLQLSAGVDMCRADAVAASCEAMTLDHALARERMARRRDAEAIRAAADRVTRDAEKLRAAEAERVTLQQRIDMLEVK